MIFFYSSDFVDEHMPKKIDEQKHESKMTCIMHKLIGQTNCISHKPNVLYVK